MVQQLGLRASTAKGPGSTPGQGTKISQAVHGVAKKTKTQKCKVGLICKNQSM